MLLFLLVFLGCSLDEHCGFIGEEAGLPYDLIFAGLDSSYCNFNGSNQYKNLDCGNKPPAYVVSISYGGNDDVSIQRQSCTEFGKVCDPPLCYKLII